MKNELTPHPQAEILRAIADGKTIQFINSTTGAWVDSENPLIAVHNCLDTSTIRIQPETITINDIDVDPPVREPLEKGQEYFLTDIYNQSLVSSHMWTGCSADRLWLERGLIHLTSGAAVAHAEALLSFTRSDR